MKPKKNSRRTIQNPCISIHLHSGSLLTLRRELQKVLKREGIEAECPNSALHVSVAYASGSTGVFDLRRVIGEIQKIETEGEIFSAQAHGFAILPGVSTPYDYLSIELEPSAWLRRAGTIAKRHLRVRGFAGGFRSHVSLLRFPKGALDTENARRLIRELNASFLAARALGSVPKWSGKCVAVSEKTRRICYKRPLRAA